MKTVKSRPRAVSQRARIRTKLLAMAGDVTLDDRKAAVKKFKKSMVTVMTYLKGEVLNNDLGLDLILFFKARIEDRETKMKTYADA